MTLFDDGENIKVINREYLKVQLITKVTLKCFSSKLLCYERTKPNEYKVNRTHRNLSINIY